jgi:hypothetical protein
MKASTLIFRKLKIGIILSTSFLFICHIRVTQFFQVHQICRIGMTLDTKIDK